MSYYRFKKDEIIKNYLKTHPECNLHMFKTTSGDCRLVYNNNKNPVVPASIAATYNLDANDEYHPPNITHVPHGFVELYGQNIARPFDHRKNNEPGLIYPFITKDSGLASMSSVSTSQFNTDFSYGDIIKGKGVRGATISTQLVSKGPHIVTNSMAATDDGDKRKRDALRTTFSYYSRLSPKFVYSTGLSTIDESNPSWEEEDFRLIQIPSIFYGEKIKKGSVKLDWYSNGELVGTLEDVNQNGELLVSHCNNPAEIGRFVGLVFYGEGFVILTNRSTIHSSHSDPRSDTIGAEEVTWMDFMEPLEEYTLEKIAASSPDYPDWKTNNASAFMDPSPYVVSSVDEVEMSVILDPKDTYPSVPDLVSVSFSGYRYKPSNCDPNQGDSSAPDYCTIHLPSNSEVTGTTAYYEIELQRDTSNKYFIKLFHITYTITQFGLQVAKTEVAPSADQKVSILEIINDNLVSTAVTYSFNLYFKGQHTIPTMLMLANLEKSEASHSNNITFLDSDRQYEKVTTAMSPKTVHWKPILLRPENPAANEIQTLKVSLEAPHGLGDSGAFFPILLKGILDSSSVDPFLGYRLACKTLDGDETHLEIYRILQDGTYAPMTTANQVTVYTYNENTAAIDETQDIGYEVTSSSSIEVLKSSYERYKPFAGKYGYYENPGFKIKNTVKSKHSDPYAEYEDHTYVSKIGIYDEDKNLIAVAKLATPVKKTPSRDYTFKIKVDL